MDGQQHGPQDARSVVLSTSHDGDVRLRVVGDLDETTVERLSALLDDVVPGGQVRVDLARAGSLPLGVLRVLAAAHRRLGGSDGAFVVVDPSPAAVRSLRTSGLDRALVVTAPAAPADAATDDAAVS